MRRLFPSPVCGVSFKRIDISYFSRSFHYEFPSPVCGVSFKPPYPRLEDGTICYRFRPLYAGLVSNKREHEEDGIFRCKLFPSPVCGVSFKLRIKYLINLGEYKMFPSPVCGVSFKRTEYGAVTDLPHAVSVPCMRG